MAHFAFVAPPFLGHLNPMMALAGELVGRGHRATFFHEADAAALLRADGVGFVPLGAASHPPGHLAGVTRRMGRADGLWGLGGVLRDVAAATDMLARELPSACRAAGIDAIVADQTEAAGGLVARHMRLPHVSVANALPLNSEPLVPPPFTSWRYDASDWGRRRNEGGDRVSGLLMRGLRTVISGWATRWRLGDLRTIEDCLSAELQISQTVPSFDMPRMAAPAAFRPVGPLRRPDPRAGRFAMPEPDGRPLAYASLGTLQGGRARLFRRIAEAAALADVRLVLAHGGLLPAREIARLPGRPHVFDFVPQAEILRHASLAILHGGLNTVLDSLAAGVPIVALPIAFEQGAIGARLVQSGAGIVVPRRLLTARRLADAMQVALSGTSYRAAAVAIADDISRAGGVRRAGDLVEALLGDGRAPVPVPLLRETAA